MLHSFGHHVPSNIIFNIIQRFFCSKEWTTVWHLFGHHIQQCCIRACAAVICIHTDGLFVASVSCVATSVRASEWCMSQVLNIWATKASACWISLRSLLVFKFLRGMAPMICRIFCKSRPGTLLPTQWSLGSWQGSSHLHGARPLETAHLLPDSETAILLLSERVTLLIILKELENVNRVRVCFLRILGRFWFQTLE